MKNWFTSIIMMDHHSVATIALLILQSVNCVSFVTSFYSRVTEVQSLLRGGRCSDTAVFLQQNHATFGQRKMTTSATSSVDGTQQQHNKDSNNDDDGVTPVWDPVAQIYVGGKVPENAAVTDLLQSSVDGSVRVFGYGSLCWNPGDPKTSALAHESVVVTPGKAVGYRRVWAQRSTDHRGTTTFPGIVCTLLSTKEYYSNYDDDCDDKETTTEGLIYKVPSDLVARCLEELDFREKGGYARDVIQVVEKSANTIVQALLYRGTCDNPAFWYRAMHDIPFAAATMAVAVGPSGSNNIYLSQLAQFLSKTAAAVETSKESAEMSQSDDTVRLAQIAQHIRNKQESMDLHFLFGSGSNQHNQLLLKDSGVQLHNDDEVHTVTEMVLLTPASTTNITTCNDNKTKAITTDPVSRIYAGGGHSGLLTVEGKLTLFGWNSSGQLGSSVSCIDGECEIVQVKSKLSLLVADVALGFNHTVIIEKDTGRLYAFGDNVRGMVDGSIDDKQQQQYSIPVTPAGLESESFVSCSAGVFHTAAVSSAGEVVLFGWNRHGQCGNTHSDSADGGTILYRWRTPDNTKIDQVACGQYHTVLRDVKGRVWTMGNNVHGQLGRHTSGKKDATPTQVDLPQNVVCQHLYCGWSHTVLACTSGSLRQEVYGFGRNDHGQLGTEFDGSCYTPRRIFEDQTSTFLQLSCGSESTYAVDQDGIVWACGWNEHGNLGVECDVPLNDVTKLTRIAGAPITTTPGYPTDIAKTAVAAGGGHALFMKVICE